MLVGIDIGGTKTAVALAEHPDCILYRQEFPTLPDLGPEHALEQIFEPYVTTKPKGTGLGLAIVKKIAEEHGGRIEAENRPDNGARVSVLLPVDDSGRATTAQRAPRSAEPKKESA